MQDTIKDLFLVKHFVINKKNKVDSGAAHSTTNQKDKDTLKGN